MSYPITHENLTHHLKEVEERFAKHQSQYDPALASSNTSYRDSFLSIRLAYLALKIYLEGKIAGRTKREYLLSHSLVAYEVTYSTTKDVEAAQRAYDNVWENSPL